MKMKKKQYKEKEAKVSVHLNYKVYYPELKKNEIKLELVDQDEILDDNAKKMVRNNGKKINSDPRISF